MKMSVALVALAGLAACGGSSGDQSGKDTKPAATATQTQEASGGGDTMSAAAWSKRVEAICVKSEAKAVDAGKRLGRESAAAGDSKQVLTYKILRLESKLLGPWVDQIDALPKPKGQEQAATKFIANMRSVGDLLDRIATAIKQDDAANGKKLVKQLAAKTLGARDQAGSLNIEKCNPSPQGVGSSS
jgi:hypothetical protein